MLCTLQIADTSVVAGARADNASPQTNSVDTGTAAEAPVAAADPSARSPELRADLPDRSAFFARLHRLGDAACRDHRRFAVLLLSLDPGAATSQSVADALGRDASIRLRVEIRRRLVGCLPPGTLVSRLWSDRFAIVLAGVAGRGEALAAAERARLALTAPVVLDGRRSFVSATVGVALSPRFDHDHPEDVLKNAATALECARRDGERCRVFDPKLLLQTAARFELDHDLRRVVERGELRLWYQPIFALASGDVAGLEALVRWQHPRRGLVAPRELLEHASALGMMPAIDRWVLAEACRQLAAWRSRFPQVPPWTISVNLAPETLASSSLVGDVERALGAAGLLPSELNLEITECSKLERSELAAANVARLRQLGAGLQIDDFGTGYCSLSYLHRFPSEALKIDRSFVAGLGDDPVKSAIVRGIVALARSLDLKVIAEGVETLAQLSHLRDLGCDAVQGFFLARPHDREDMTLMLAKIARDRRGRAKGYDPVRCLKS